MIVPAVEGRNPRYSFFFFPPARKKIASSFDDGLRSQCPHLRGISLLCYFLFPDLFFVVFL